MGIYAWDLDGGFSTPQPVRNPRLTPLGFTEVIFGRSPRYGIHTALEAHQWFLGMMGEHEEFEVETDLGSAVADAVLE